jgi:hypothetical protein
MSLFGVLRLRLSPETAPNSAQDDEFDDNSMVTKFDGDEFSGDEFNDENNF